MQFISNKHVYIILIPILGYQHICPGVRIRDDRIFRREWKFVAVHEAFRNHNGEVGYNLPRVQEAT